MSNLSTYSKKAMTIYEIVGAYFVDIFFNIVYDNSLMIFKTKDLQGTRSLTDIYKTNINAYCDGIKKNKNYYIKVVEGIVGIFRTRTNKSNVSMGDCIDEILRQFVPDEYFNELTVNNKNIILRDVLITTMENFADEIYQIDMMRLVIDDHSNVANVRIWMDCIDQIQIVIRETYHNKFIKTEKNTSSEAVLLRKVVAERDKIWKELENTLKEKIKWETDYHNMKKIAEELFKKVVAVEKEKMRPTTTRAGVGKTVLSNDDKAVETPVVETNLTIASKDMSFGKDIEIVRSADTSKVQSMSPNTSTVQSMSPNTSTVSLPPNTSTVQSMSPNTSTVSSSPNTRSQTRNVVLPIDDSSSIELDNLKTTRSNDEQTTFRPARDTQTEFATTPTIVPPTVATNFLLDLDEDGFY